MSKKNWQPPKTPQEAMMTLEEISSVLQFIKDLSVQPTSPAEEYSFSPEGYYGFYYFLGFVQDKIEECHQAIHKSSKTEREVN
ncbi:MAG: hypothetical protein QY310_08720 [Candidatus Jettenia sp. CY-1]|nr:MAG: hypothetical protein QY310_08720 [Candidatus Jettenia sp. CY-1]